ncbi:unnamed protein product, partial [Prorocentrum cordatum]
MGKPKNFTGREDDWHQWAITMLAYARAISERLLFLMDEAELSTEFSTQLYYILTTLLEGKASDKVTLVGSLTDEHEGKAVTRAKGLLQQVLGFGFESDDVLHELGRFEKVVQQYENATGKTVDDDLRTGIVIMSIRQDDLARHVVMNSDRFDTHDKIKDDIIGIYRTKEYLVTGPLPMDVSAVDARARCDVCGKTGHTRRDCWYQGNPVGKGRGKGKDGGNKGTGKNKDGGKNNEGVKFGGGRGHGGGGKGGAGAGKGDTHFNGECGYCGIWGRKRAHCRKLQAARGQEGQRRQIGQLRRQGSATTSLASTQQLGSLVLCSVERGEIGSVGDRLVRIGVDSGAGVTVWPKDLCSDCPIKYAPESRSGLEHVPAGKGSKGIVDLGERTCDMVSSDGHNLSMKVHVCDVRKPLLSAAEVNDMDLDVHFYADSEKGACAIHPQTGRRVSIERINIVRNRGARAPLVGGQRAGLTVGRDVGKKQLRWGPVTLAPLQAHGDADVGRPKLRVLASPTMLAPDEVAEHNACHLPRRAWRRHCAAGRGKADQHRASEAAGQTPTLRADYGFLCEKHEVEKIESSTIPFIVVKDGPPPTGARWLDAHAAQSKGVQHEYSARIVAQDIVSTRRDRFIFKSDGEPALEAVKKSAVSEVRRTGAEVNVTPEFTDLRA